MHCLIWFSQDYEMSVHSGDACLFKCTNCKDLHIQHVSYTDFIWNSCTFYLKRRLMDNFLATGNTLYFHNRHFRLHKINYQFLRHFFGKKSEGGRLFFFWCHLSQDSNFPPNLVSWKREMWRDFVLEKTKWRPEMRKEAILCWILPVCGEFVIVNHTFWRNKDDKASREEFSAIGKHLYDV